MTTKYLKILFLVMLLSACTPVWAQNWNMVSGDTLLIDGCRYASGAIYDNGGQTGNYSDSFDGWAIIEASPYVQITISGNYTTESGYDLINIWDNDVLVRENLSGTGSVSVSCTSGRVVIRFTTDVSVNRSGFRLNYVVTGGSSSANRVNNLTANNITSTGATLNWTSGNSGPFHILCNNPIDDTVTTTSTSFSLTGLNPSTRHTATVYAEGMANDRCASGTVVFRTLCGTSRLPFSEDFNDMEPETVAPCWTYSVNFDDAFMMPRVTTFDNINNVQLLSCGSNSTGGHFGMVVTPTIASDAPKWHVRFLMNVSHAYTNVVVGFCDSTSTEQASYGFTPVETITPNSSGWISYSRSYVVPSGGCRLAFRMEQSSQSGVGRIAYIDDLIIETCGVRQIEVVHPDTTSFELLWDTVGTPDVTVRVKSVWGDGATLLFSNATSPLTVTGLTPGTRYEVVIYASCNSDQSIPSRIYANTLSTDLFENDLCLILSTWNPASNSYQLDEQWSMICTGGSAPDGYGDISQLGNNCYLISPPLNAPGGKELMIEYISTAPTNKLIIGTMTFADDLTTFTPIDTIELASSSGIVDTALRLPNSITDNYLVFKGLVNGNSTIGIRSLSLNGGHVKRVSVEIVRSTSVTLQWEEPSTGKVYIEYYSSFSGPHYTDSVTNSTQATITGLTPEQTYYFDLYLPGESACPHVGEVSAVTARRDYNLPYCEDFEDFMPNELYGWNARSTLYSCPTESSEYVHSGAYSLKLSATGSSNAIAALPEIDSMGGSIISFWATTVAPGSSVTVGFYAPNSYLFQPIASLPIAGNAGWRHYWCAVPDSVVGRLALRYELTGCDGIYYVWIDDLALSMANYADYTFANLGCTSIDVVWQAVGSTDSLTVIMVSGNDSISVTGVPDTIHVTGLSDSRLYTCYIIPHGGCMVTAGKFNTLHCQEGEAGGAGDDHGGDGGGGGGGGGGIAPQRCNSMDDLLSNELPHGWVFGDSLLASLVADGEGGNHLQMLSPDSVGAWDSVTLPRFSYNALYLRARALSRGVLLAACGDTVELDTVWRSYAFPYASPCVISVSGGAGCLLDDVGQSYCPRVLFDVDGNALSCTVEGNYRYEYILHLMDSDGNERGQHITTTPFTIEDLEPEEEYSVWWEFLYMDASCVPVFEIGTEALPVPYCIDMENNNSTLPAGWIVTQRPGIEDIGFSGTNGMTFSAGNYNWNYLILPQMEMTDYLQLCLYGSFTGLALEIGHLTNGTDTSSFVVDTATVHNAMNIEENYSFGLRGIGAHRIALRYKGYCLTVRRLGLSRDPRLDYHIYAPGTLTVVAETDSSYRLGWNSSDSWPASSIRTVTTNPRTIGFGNGNIYLKQFGGIADCNFYKMFYKPATTTLPFCDDGGINDINYVYTAFPNSSYNVAHTYSNGHYCYRLMAGERPTVFVFPYLSNSTVDNTKFSFDCMVDSPGSSFEIGVMSDLLDTSTFVTVATVTCSASGWHRRFVDMSNYSGSGRWIAIRAKGPGSYGSIYLCNFRLDACFLPATTSVHVENYTEVVIEGNADSVANGPFWVEYGPYGILPGQGTLRHFDSLPARLNLAASSEYSLYIYCSSNRNGCSNHYHVYTPDLPLYAPSCTGFEDASLNYMPRGWSAVTGPSVVTNAASHSGSRSLAVHGIVATPVIDVDSLGETALGFWMKATQTGAYLIVGSMVSPSSPSSFHPLRVIVPRQVGVWEYHLVSLADAPANARHIAFRNVSSSNSHNLFIDDLLLTQCALLDLRITGIDNASITLGWQRFGNPDAAVTVLDRTTSTTTVHDLSSLSANTLTIPIIPQHEYLITTLSSCPDEGMPCGVPYADTIRIAVPADGYGCVDPADMQSPQAVFFSGTFSNPYANVGPIDFGALESHSRHTVNTDTSARDPRTGGLLRTIPPGYASSVRLGNWSSNSLAPEAEGVIYSLSVDTLDFTLLLLHYAAVLQNPMHAPEDQPRFRLELLDTNYNLIDPLCTAADFIANSSLGWNAAPDNVLWKDWTTVGVDLTAYHGQRLFLRLTTYDCNEGSHYGYAYFTLECMSKTITAENCGNAGDNIFTAPSGFNYRWYSTADSSTLSTEQTLVAPTSQTTYLCDLSFIGNPSCHFTLSAFGGTRFPLARFDTLVSYSNCGIHVQFINRSTVSSDGINPVASGESAESAHWIFGNGLSSDSYHAYTTYTAPGTYLVTLVASISGGECTDTLIMPLSVDFPSHPLIVGPSELCYGDRDTLRLLNATTADSLWQLGAGGYFLPISPADYPQPTAGLDVSHLYLCEAHSPYGCTDTLAHPLVVHPVFTRFDSIRICTPQLPFTYADTTFLPGTTLIDYHHPETSVPGCDSSLHLHLLVAPATEETILDTTDASICDNEHYTFFGTDYNTEGTHLFSHVDSLGRCDTLYSLVLDVRPTSAADTVAEACDSLTWHGTTYSASTTSPTFLSTNSVNCDSVTTLLLTIHPSYVVTDSIVVCQNQRFLYEGVDYGGPIAFDSPHLSRYDCDSLVHVVLYPSSDRFPSPPAVSTDSSLWHPYDTTILACDPSRLILADTSIAVSRLWTFWGPTLDTLQSTLPTLDMPLSLIDGPATEPYAFQLITVSPEGCHDTVGNDSLLFLFPSPHADFIWAPDHLSIHSPELQLYNRSTPDTCSYLWLFAQAPGEWSDDMACDSSFEVNPHHAWEVNTEPGEYPVALIAYLHHPVAHLLSHLAIQPLNDTATLSCPDTAIVPILIANTYLQFPNSVTPNGDGINDRWVIVNLLEMGEYSMNELWIYDRWGSLVYHVKNIHQMSDFWDPDATRSPDGTYYYRFSAKNNFGLVKRNGVIEVSR